jgi:outer membrane protein assembly factor BamB
MVVSGCECVTSYDPDTGKPYWIIDGPTEQFCASLVYTDGMFMMTGGWPEHHILGIRPDGTGNVTDTHVAWHLTEAKITSYVPSPIAAGKYFFVVSDGGVATCLEAKTGRKMWSERLGKHHSASPVSAEGRLYFLDDAGVMHVLRAAPEFEVLAENDLGEACRASPAVSRGQMFLRTRHHVYCIGASAEDG